VAVPEDDRPIVHAHEQALVVWIGVGRKAVDVGERRAVDVQDPVQLGVGGEVEEPVFLLLGYSRAVLLIRLRDLGPVGGRLLQPALAVPADPDRVR
jgi:hypothetical protein